jgi:phosphoglycerate dehydrogenase-like enzyme
MPEPRVPDAPRVAIAPSPAEHLAEAVADGGGRVVPPTEAEAVVWSDPRSPDGLRELLDGHPSIRWVQLPWAGIEPFADVLDDDHVWTCGKGVYAEPVAEHALALTLAGLRHLVGYAGASSWGRPAGRNLLGARVTVLGGGEITASYLRLLAPFGCHVTVVTKHPRAIDGADEVRATDELHAALTGADVVVLALALTPETEHVIDAAALAQLPPHAWLVNVARGRHVDTDALVDALRDGRLGGAALDVTDPEPLPDDHPLWSLDRVIVTPHTANTPEMGRPLLARRVAENVRRFAADEPLIGPVDPSLGY